MKPIVHWLRFDPQGISGLYNYVYSLNRATKALGYESHICYSDADLNWKGEYTFPSPLIGNVEFSPWSVAENAINITHDMTPQIKLDNWVAEMHGHPHYMATMIEAVTAGMYDLERAELLLTRFPSHVHYWEQATSKPIHVIPPGVDLDFWKPIGPKTPFNRPMVLWADTVRDAVKSPINLLYAMKILNKEMPAHGLKLVGIPMNEIAGYAYVCGALRLDSIVEFPIESIRKEMGELYRGATIMYSDTNLEGSNSSWEAEACGLPVVHHQDSPQEIANSIMTELTVQRANPPPRRDIKETAKRMMQILDHHFDGYGTHVECQSGICD